MAALPMRDEEIVRQYIQAKNKAKQCQILADLNGVEVGVIRAVLVENGVDWRALPRCKSKPEDVLERLKTDLGPETPPAEEPIEDEPVEEPEAEPVEEPEAEEETCINIEVNRNEQNSMLRDIEDYITFRREEIKRLQTELDAFLKRLSEIMEVRR